MKFGWVLARAGGQMRLQTAADERVTLSIGENLVEVAAARRSITFLPGKVCLVEMALELGRLL